MAFLFKLVAASLLLSAAFGATCESQGGKCSRKCDGGEWAFHLICTNSRRSCCFDTVDVEVPTSAPVAPVNPSDIPGQANCGVKLANRIISGQDADEAEYPWQVSLYHHEYAMHVCGGSLVSNEFVVTAAHCVSGSGWDHPSDFKVVLGEHHLARDSGNEVEREVVEIIKHENYRDRSPWPNDIALLRLSSPVSVGPHINTVCLPNTTDDFTSGDDCWVTGWGDSQGTADENILQEIPAVIRTNEDCRAAWGKDILDTMLCNSDGGSGSCSGDSGGPLQCSKSGRTNLVGVVSWGTADCTTIGLPGVYTRVTSYVAWVAAKVASASNRKVAPVPTHY